MCTEKVALHTKTKLFMPQINTEQYLHKTMMMTRKETRVKSTAKYSPQVSSMVEGLKRHWAMNILQKKQEL